MRLTEERVGDGDSTRCEANAEMVWDGSAFDLCQRMRKQYASLPGEARFKERCGLSNIAPILYAAFD